MGFESELYFERRPGAIFGLFNLVLVLIFAFRNENNFNSV